MGPDQVREPGDKRKRPVSPAASAEPPRKDEALRDLASAVGNRGMGQVLARRPRRRRWFGKDKEGEQGKAPTTVAEGPPKKGDAPPPRKEPPPIDYVFIMSESKDGFYTAARKHYIDMKGLPGAKVSNATSLEEVVDTITAGSAKARNVYIVTHASPIGMMFGLHKSDTNKFLWLDKLEAEAATMGEKLKDKVDDSTAIRIRGCNIGRNQKFVRALHTALGGVGLMEAPTHRTHYEWESENGKTTKSWEWIPEYALVFRDEKEHRKYTPDELAPMFAAKYPRSGITEEQWLEILKKVKPKPLTKTGKWDVTVDPGTTMKESDAIDIMKRNVNEPDEYRYAVQWGKGKKSAVVSGTQLRYQVPTNVIEKVTGKKRGMPAVTDKDYADFMYTETLKAKAKAR